RVIADVTVPADLGATQDVGECPYPCSSSYRRCLADGLRMNEIVRHRTHDHLSKRLPSNAVLEMSPCIEVRRESGVDGIRCACWASLLPPLMTRWRVGLAGRTPATHVWSTDDRQNGEA